MIEINVIEYDKKHEKLSFILKNANPVLANTIRRLIVDSVPTMAIEIVEFKKNSSVLYDEIVAHRLGLLPLTTDLKSYIPLEKSKLEDPYEDPRCTLKLTLSAKGPGAVYASEIKSKDPKVKPVFPKVPIVKLLKGQDIELQATAVLGYGKAHAKWSPGLAYYRYKPHIEIVKQVTNPDQVVKSCPTVFESKNGKLQINKDNLFECNTLDQAREIAKPEGAIKLTESDTEFIFKIESWGQLSCKEILIKAVDSFDEQVDLFIEEIKKS
ncbi:MAG: DNA-directed RNA polymerase subunit D [Candidatus Woesearchaeota archaeon]|jgi:DNA-directed RNA polymerase subunit D|nr:DNA-directed RNA polymerase subunit D [Candidatus Woesearchaeota archaeon]MDP7324050.1 DNA-directed RNA polymerase subunit D [Candidatus Woesearchaeota archaeon]MDP7457399.1 DNA-directed RNA polymerase subunit D [Candidatus Woesearchaeota archaeon]